MTIKDYKDGKLIEVEGPFDSRAKFLFLFKGFVFFIPALLLLWLFLFLFNDYNYGGALLTAIVAVICFILVYKFFNKSLASVKLFIDQDKLEIINKNLFKSSKESFDRTKISNFRFLEKPELTKHALSGESFDYLGFQTEQHVANEMYGDHRLAFEYEGRSITFGNEIYSWQFEELAMLLHGISDKRPENAEVPEIITREDQDITLKELSREDYLSTISSPMINVTQTSNPVLYIWPYVEQLVSKEIVPAYVVKDFLVEVIYRNQDGSFDHVLLPTSNNDVKVCLIISLHETIIRGHYLLDLKKEYSL